MLPTFKALRRKIFLLIALLVGLIGNCTAAYASNPSFYYIEPSSGATLYGSSIGIRAWGSDAHDIDLSQSKLYIDGQFYMYGVHSGHDESPCCSDSSWWVTDTNTVRFDTWVTLPDGLHTFRAETKDVFGYPTTLQWSVTIKEAPWVSFTSPAGDSWNQPQPTVTARITDNTQIDTSTIVASFNGAPVSYTYTPDIVNSVPSIKAGTLTFTPTVPLPQGSNTATVSVKDMSGNLRTTNWNINVDSVGPVFSNPQPAPGSNTLSNVSISLTGTDAYNNIDLTKSKLFLNEVHVANGTNPSYKVVDFSCTPPPLNDGLYNVRAVSADNLGNESSYSWSFNVTEPPNISGVTPTNNSKTNTHYPTISANISDNTKINEGTLMVTIDGNPVPVNYNILSIKSGTFTYTPNIGLSEGVHTLAISVQDGNGNLASSTTTFTIDTSVYNEDINGPTYSNISPVNGSTTMNPPSTTNISVKVTDGNGINWDSRLLTLDNITTASTSYSTIDSYNGTITASLTGLSLSTHTLRLSTTDNLGNPTTLTWSFTLTSCANGQYGSPTGLIACSSDQYINAHFQDTLGHTLLTSYKYFEVTYPDGSKVLYNGSTSPAVSAYNPTYDADPEDFNPPVTLYNELEVGLHLPNLTPGTYTVTVKAQDTLGNIGEETWSFTANTPPALSEHTPPHGVTFEVSPSVISVKAEDADGIDPSSIKLTFNWVERSHSYDPVTGIISWNCGTISDTWYQLPVAVEVKDNLGTLATSDWGFIVKDTIAPRLDSVSPASGGLVGPDTTVSATASDPRGFDTSQTVLYINGTSVPNIYSTSGNSMTVTGTNLASYFVNGANTARIVVKDNSPQKNVRDYSWTFTVDKTAPDITNLTPANGSNIIYPPGNVSVSALISDNNVVNPASAVLTLDGNVVGCNYNAIDTKTGTITASVVNPALGLHTLILTIADSLGNAKSSTWNFNVYDPPPTISSPSPSGTVLKSGSMVTFSATAVDSHSGINGSTVRFKLDSGAYQTGTYNAENNKISYAIDDTALILGNHTAEFRVKDNSGSEAVYAWSFSFWYITPAQGAVVGGKPTISAITDFNGINAASIVLKLDGVSIPHTFNESTGLISYIVPATLASGVHNVSLSVADKQDVVKNVAWSFDADITAPTFSALTPSNNTYFADPTGTIEFSAKVADDYGINANSWVLKLDNDTVVSSYNVVGSKNGTVQGSFNNVPPGWHTLTVSIADNVGLSSTTSWKIRVTETTGPTVTEKSPVGDLYYKNTKPQIKARVQDPNEIDSSSVILKVNGVMVTHVYDVDNLKSGLVTFDNPSSYPGGKNTVELTVKDDLGNQTVETWTFTIGANSNLEDIHGSYTSNVDACMACHKTHQAKAGKLINREKEQQTCYYCHDGVQTATDLREEFGESAGGSSSKVSHHKVAEGTTRCSDCHNPHGKPTERAFLLAAGESSISSGNNFCGVCHQSIKTNVAGTSHGSTTAMAPLDTTNITCLKCHEAHSSDYVALLKSPITNKNGIKRSFTGNNSSMCETCHNDKKGLYEGEYVFNQTKHGTLASSMAQTVITHTSKTDFQAGSLDNLTATATGELQLTDAQKPGKFISPVLNISGSANVSGLVKWDASGTIKVRTNVSLDGGTTWQGWNEVANNYIPGLNAATNFSNARLKYEVTLTNGSITPQLREITIIIYKENPLYTPVTALKTYPGTDNSGCNNCHDPHGTPNAYSLRATGNTLCLKCHDDVSVTYPANSSYQGITTYNATLHGASGVNIKCTNCHNPHGKDTGTGTPISNQLKAAGDKNCLNCHNTGWGTVNVKAKFAGGGVTSHEVVTTQQAAEGAKIGCENCHNPHKNNATNKIMDFDNPPNFYKPGANGFDDFMSKHVSSDREVYVLVKAKHEGTPAVFSNIQVTANTQSIHVQWTTNEYTHTPIIEWGPTASYGNSAAGTDYGDHLSHWATIYGLTQGSTYHFRLKSTDLSGNVTVSEDMTASLFSPTLVDEPATNSNGPTTITLEWSGVPGSLYYAEFDDAGDFTNAYGNRQVLNWTTNTSWTINLPYTPEKGYCWRVKSKVNGIEYDWGSVTGQTVKFDSFLHGEYVPSGGYYCPLVFADKGNGFEYISDLSGPTINQTIPALKGDIKKTLPYSLPLNLDTTQKSFKVKIRSLKEKEIDILDNVMLTVVDHAPGYEIISTSGEDKALRGESKERLYAISKDALPPQKVSDKNGVDVTSYLKYSDNEPVPVEYKEGFESYILDFGTLQKPENAKLVLDGWTVFEDDNHSTKHTPRVEVMNAQGQWEIVREIGHISGDKKSMVVNLSKAFKTSDHRVRIFVGTPAAKVVLDRVRMDQSVSIPLQMGFVEASVADLHFRGKATEVLKTLKNPAFFKDNALQKTLGYTFYGSFTKYGDVKELLKDQDDKFVVMQYGDEVSLEFKNPPLQKGLTRSVLLYTDFYEKQTGAVSDGKLPVEPLPFHNMSDYPYQSPEKYPDDPEHQKYLQEWQTREYLLDGGNVVLSKDTLWNRLVKLLKGLFGTAKATAPEDTNAQTNIPSQPIVPEKHYSLNTNYTFLWLDSIDKTVSCIINPTGADGSNAWEGTSTPAANAQGKPDATTPGWSQASSAKKTAVSADESPKQYWVTGLAVENGAYDMQMMKFKVPSDMSRIQSLRFYWDGYGDYFEGYNVEIYLWDFTKTGSNKWEQIENKHMPTSTVVTLDKTLGYRDYCLKCHDNTPPAGLNMGSYVNIGALYSKERHGGKSGSSWGTSLKPPFSSGMSLSCTSCHDIHGSSNDFHLREQINGQYTSFKGTWYSDPYGYGVYGGYSNETFINFCSVCHSGSIRDFHIRCINCHGEAHHYGDTVPTLFWETFACSSCHGHGKKTSYTHTGYALFIDNVSKSEPCGNKHCQGPTYPIEAF